MPKPFVSNYDKIAVFYFWLYFWLAIQMHENYFKYSPSVWIIPTLLILLMWSVFYIDDSFNLHLTQLGIYPRTFSGLFGVFCSPFLHGNLNHLANNTIFFLQLYSIFTVMFRWKCCFTECSFRELSLGWLVANRITLAQADWFTWFLALFSSKDWWVNITDWWLCR